MLLRTLADDVTDVTVRCGGHNWLGSGGRRWTCHAHNGDTAVSACAAAGGCEGDKLERAQIRKDLMPKVREVPGLPRMTLFASLLEVTGAPLTEFSMPPTTTSPDCAAPPQA